MDESTGPSNSLYDDDVVHTSRDDVPNPATGTQEVTETENDQQIEALTEVLIE